MVKWHHKSIIPSKMARCTAAILQVIGILIRIPGTTKYRLE